MTDHGPGNDPTLVADDALGRAYRAAQAGQQKLAETQSLLSIAASLYRIGDLLETRPAAPETLTVLPEVERVAGGCCCQDDDLLEFAFGLVCNADHAIGSGGQALAEWDAASRRFIDAYNAKVQRMFGGSLGDQLIQARAELAALKKDDQ